MKISNALYIVLNEQFLHAARSVHLSGYVRLVALVLYCFDSAQSAELPR